MQLQQQNNSRLDPAAKGQFVVVFRHTPLVQLGFVLSKYFYKQVPSIGSSDRVKPINCICIIIVLVVIIVVVISFLSLASRTSTYFSSKFERLALRKQQLYTFERNV